MAKKTPSPALPSAFKKLGLNDKILRGLAEVGYEEPSPIQALVIPEALREVDILGQARTGTGKTAAFGLPILELMEPGVEFQALILVPTRELCIQVNEELEKFSKYTGMSTVATYGGQRIEQQVKKIERGPEIIVGTPGRVMDLYKRKLIHFNHVDFAILDEVDRMLDIGFRDDIKQILGDVNRRRSNEGFDGTPIPLQTIFVSATLSREIEALARKYMRDDEVVKLIAPGADEKPTVDKVEQFYVTAGPWDKPKATRLLLQQEQPELAMIFTRTKRNAEKVAKRLTEDGFEVRELHGNLNQAQREKVMKGFRGGKFNVLVATDVASRGLDVGGVTHVVNYDVPDDPEAYVHRVGRTARMGASGRAFMFVAPDQGDELTRIEALINMEIPAGEIDGYEPRPEPNRDRREQAYPGQDAFLAEKAAAEADAPAEEEQPKRRRRYAGKVVRKRRR